MQDPRKTRQVLRHNYTVAGIQDGSFESFKRELDRNIQHTSLCCTRMMRDYILGVRLRIITVDGMDSTSLVLDCLNGWDLDAIILGGASFAGFNIIDFENLYKQTNYPIIVFSSVYPDVEATKQALFKHFKDWKLRIAKYKTLGEIHEFFVKKYLPPIYYEAVGCSTGFAEKVLKEQSIVSRTPEALRVADLIAKGVTPIVQGLLEYVDG